MLGFLFYFYLHRVNVVWRTNHEEEEKFDLKYEARRVIHESVFF